MDTETRIIESLKAILPEGFTVFDVHLNGIDSVLIFLDSPHGRDHISLVMVGTSTHDLKQLASHALKLIKAKHKENGNG